MSNKQKWILVVVLFLVGFALIGWNLRDPDASLREPPKSDKKLTLDQVPTAVRETIERESAGGVIKEIEAEMEGNTIVNYEIDIIKGNEEIEVDVLEDGTVTERDSKPAKR